MPRPTFDPRYVTLRQLLAEERRRAGMTQQELADRLGRPQSYVSKVEKGERRIDPIEFLDIARAIGADVCGILERVEQR